MVHSESKNFPASRLVKETPHGGHIDRFQIETEMGSRILQVLKKSGHLGEKNTQNEHQLCCMDDRLPKHSHHVNLAGSGILILGDLIAQKKDPRYIYSFVEKKLASHNITHITSHSNCGAAMLFCKKIAELFGKNPEHKEDIWNALCEYFPELEGSSPKTYSYDDIAAKFLEHLAQKSEIEYSHIIIPEDIKHSSTSVIVDLTHLDIKGLFEKKAIQIGYYLDASICLKNEILLEKMAEEAIIAKIIASNSPGITKENPMKVYVLYEVNKKTSQVGLAESLVNDINSGIHKNYPHLDGLYQISAIKI